MHLFDLFEEDATEGKIIHPDRINLYLNLRKPNARPIQIAHNIPYKAMDAVIAKLVSKYSDVEADMFEFRPARALREEQDPAVVELLKKMNYRMWSKGDGEYMMTFKNTQLEFNSAGVFYNGPPVKGPNGVKPNFGIKWRHDPEWYSPRGEISFEHAWKMGLFPNIQGMYPLLKSMDQGGTNPETVKKINQLMIQSAIGYVRSQNTPVNEDSGENDLYAAYDKILIDLCDGIVKHQKQDSDRYGLVAAAVVDPEHNVVYGINHKLASGKRVHAERAAMANYIKKHGAIPENSVIITTLSPCTDEMPDRKGPSCTELLNGSPITRVYAGYRDPSQTHLSHDLFDVVYTQDKRIEGICKDIADCFLDESAYTDPANYRGESITEAKKRKAKTLIDGMIKTLERQGRTKDEAIADIKKQVDTQFYESIDHLVENFADGKHPGRKGLAKRSGVNTKASVSSLRKTAKHSTGEKARMAHWLANMKAGKKKHAKEAVDEDAINEIENLQSYHYTGGKDVLKHPMYTDPRAVNQKNIKPLPGSSGLNYATIDNGRLLEIRILDQSGQEAIGQLKLLRVSFPIDNAYQVSTVTVDEDYRGRGIAKSLYGVALSILKITLLAGSQQTPGGKRNWMSLAQIPGVEVRGYVELENSDLKYKKLHKQKNAKDLASAERRNTIVDKNIDIVMGRLGGDYLGDDEDGNMIFAFDVVPGTGSLMPAVKTELNKLYYSEYDMLYVTGLYAQWRGA